MTPQENARYTPQELKPCPFCGGAAYFTASVNGSNMIYAGCSPCGIAVKAQLIYEPSGWKPTKDVCAIWNQRGDETTRLQSRVEMLECALIELFDIAIPQAQPWKNSPEEKAEYSAKVLPEKLRALLRGNKARVEQLERDIDNYQAAARRYQEIIGEFQQKTRAEAVRIAEIVSNNEALRTALRQYGRHTDLCSFRYDSQERECDCGFAHAVSGEQSDTPETETKV